MLQRLERADQLAELCARLQIFERDVEGLRRLPQHLRCHAGARTIEHRVERGETMIDGSQHIARTYLDPGEFEIGCASAVDALELRALQAVRIAWHEEQRDAILVASFAGRAR